MFIFLIFIISSESILLFLNIFKAPTKEHKDRNKLNLFITGLTNPDNTDLKGLYNFLENIPKKVVVHVVNYYKLESKYNKFIKSGIVKSYTDLDAQKMLELLGKCHFVLTIVRKNSSYHKEQLTGIIPLAISYGVPMIMDKKLSNIYGLSDISITYTFYDEVNSILRGVKKAIKFLEKEDYSKLQNKLVKFRDNVIDKQRKNNVFL